MKTFIETLFEAAVAANSPVIPINNCDTVVLTGPTRLASQNPEAFKSLAMTALQGYSAKAVLKNGNGAPATITQQHAAGTYCVALIVTICGAPQAFRRMPILLEVSYTSGAAATNVVVYPKDTRCQALVITCQDNGGIGQVARGERPQVVHTHVAGDGFAANEWGLASEIVTLRDFTSRASN